MTQNGINGTAAQVKMSFIPRPPAGGKVLFTTTAGDYLGTVEYEAMSPEALREVANQFQAFVAAQFGGIQVAGSGAAAALKLV